MVHPDVIYFAVVGDLAFFYDMNSIGNRHINSNLRLLIVNNGLGTEFKTYNHHTSHFGDQADRFISAAGHFGKQSPELVKNYAESLGFEYLTASSKKEFETVHERFVTPEVTDKPMVLEVFTNSEEESKALELMMNLEIDSSLRTKKQLEGFGRKVLGKTGVNVAKRVLGR